MQKYKDKKQYRYKNYDYSNNGFYFVTICTKNRGMFFGEIKNGKMKLSNTGIIAEKFWQQIHNHFSFVNLHEFVIMPNHIHGIIEINNDLVGTGHCPVQNNASKFSAVSPKSLSTIIGSYKSIVTKTINLKNRAVPCSYGDFGWQPRFHDRIIRDEKELDGASQYIINNPSKWEIEKNNPENLYM